MKLNWAEQMVVNNPLRVVQQRIEIPLFKKMMPLKSGAKVLEVGCGRGAGAKLILKKFQPAILHALDLDIWMMQKAKKYLTSKERKKVSLYVGDVFRLPFKDGSFNAIMGFGVLHHVPGWRGALHEIARVLKKGGIYYLEELYPSLYQNFITKRILLHPEQDRFHSQDLKNALTDANMPLIEALESKKLGILGVAVKSGKQFDDDHKEQGHGIITGFIKESHGV